MTRKRTTSAFASIGGVIVTRMHARIETRFCGDRAPGALVQPGRVREERRGVAVRPDAEEIQPQAHAFECRVVLGRGLLGIGLAADPAHGSRLHGEVVEQRPLRHAEVRALVVRRHATLVAPPDLDVAPVRLQPRRASRARAPATCRRKVRCARRRAQPRRATRRRGARRLRRLRERSSRRSPPHSAHRAATSWAAPSSCRTRRRGRSSRRSPSHARCRRSGRRRARGRRPSSSWHARRC